LPVLLLSAAGDEDEQDEATTTTPEGACYYHDDDDDDYDEWLENIPYVWDGDEFEEHEDNSQDVLKPLRVEEEERDENVGSEGTENTMNLEFVFTAVHFTTVWELEVNGRLSMAHLLMIDVKYVHCTVSIHVEGRRLLAQDAMQQQIAAGQQVTMAYMIEKLPEEKGANARQRMADHRLAKELIKELHDGGVEVSEELEPRTKLVIQTDAPADDYSKIIENLGNPGPEEQNVKSVKFEEPKEMSNAAMSTKKKVLLGVLGATVLVGVTITFYNIFSARQTLDMTSSSPPSSSSPSSPSSLSSPSSPSSPSSSSSSPSSSSSSSSSSSWTSDCHSPVQCFFLTNQVELMSISATIVALALICFCLWYMFRKRTYSPSGNKE
jgi:hypothetical protein